MSDTCGNPNTALSLNADRRGHTCQIGVRRESLVLTATLVQVSYRSSSSSVSPQTIWHATKGTNYSAIDNIVASCEKLVTDSLELSRDQIAVPSHGVGIFHWEARHIHVKIKTRGAIAAGVRSP